ncbi:MAG: chemotaxis protein CheW [Planctomycetota bacterium]
MERVRSKALERGVITQEQSECMSARELTNLIFSPGFSTAEKVTNVSGRGVGLDVVRTNIEKISGTIDLQAQAGQGTTVRIKIPLTLAIIPGLIVTCREQRYAIPQVSLVELVRFNRDQEVSGIEFVHGAPVHRLRGNLLPLVFLDQALGLGDHTVPRPSGSAPTRYPTTLPEARKAGRWVSAEPAPHDAEAVNIVVLQADECQFGLVVDHVNDTQEIVVKPLGKQLKGISCFAGAAILGDGRVALILDVLGLAQEATVLGKERGQIAPDAAVGVDGNEAEAQTLLLFSVGDDSRMAIPLSMVTRLEEFERSGFEQAGDQTVVQYRGGILPLIDLSSVFEREKLEQDDVVQVVVYSDNGRQVGFLVDEILDILETSLAVERCTDRKGILGSAIIQEKVTDLIDPQSVIRTHYPGVSDDHAGIPAEA